MGRGPWTAQQRLERLNGVVAAGTLTDVDVKNALVSTVDLNDTRGITKFQMTVKAASPGLFRAVRTRLGQGRVFDQGHSVRSDRVAVLGRGAAERLNITRVDQQPAILIGNRLFVVMGIVDDVAREPDLLDGVIIPDGTARTVYRLQAPLSVHVDTSVGAAKLVASQVAIALDPNDPTRLSVSEPAEPKRVKEGVQQDVNSLFLILGAVSLLVGAIGIANVTLVSVLERTGEIGLRRALGAARRHIAGQFLAESTVMGLIGIRSILHLTDHLLFLYDSNFNVLKGGFTTNRGSLKILSQCECWTLTLSLNQLTNPNETRFNFNFNLLGLGSQAKQASR